VIALQNTWRGHPHKGRNVRAHRKSQQFGVGYGNGAGHGLIATGFCAVVALIAAKDHIDLVAVVFTGKSAVVGPHGTFHGRGLDVRIIGMALALNG
jgi:hypothetical protein